MKLPQGENLAGLAIFVAFMTMFVCITLCDFNTRKSEVAISENYSNAAKHIADVFGGK